MRNGRYLTGEAGRSHQVNARDWRKCSSCQHARIIHVRSRGHCGIPTGRPAVYQTATGAMLYEVVPRCPCLRYRVKQQESHK